MSRKKSRGFTLFELIIVVVIVLIIGAACFRGCAPQPTYRITIMQNGRALHTYHQCVITEREGQTLEFRPDNGNGAEIDWPIYDLEMAQDGQTQFGIYDDD